MNIVPRTGQDVTSNGMFDAMFRSNPVADENREFLFLLGVQLL